MNRLEGKVCMVTGAARGMGAAHARRFVAEGAKVVLTDLDENLGRALSEELGPSTMFVRHDVASAKQWAAVVAAAEGAFGPVTVLVNNAGILGPMQKTADLTEADYIAVCAVNQHSVFFGMSSVIPSMLRAGMGSIVNVSSIADMVAIRGFPSTAYVASKFAVQGMTKSTAIEYAAHGIRVNSVHPGYILTSMMTELTDSEGRDVTPLVALGRVADSSEVSNLVLFLASDEASYITGAEHVIDAGMSA